MSRKKDEDLEGRLVLVAMKCAELEKALHESRRETMAAEDAYSKLADAISGLRSQLDDMRKVRDRAVDNAEGAEMRLRDKQMELARCLGWIDAKMDKSPQIDDFGRIPF
jgi:septal ring factor EnvC (AmiA/AmiB activator)